MGAGSSVPPLPSEKVGDWEIITNRNVFWMLRVQLCRYISCDICWYRKDRIYWYSQILIWIVFCWSCVSLASFEPWVWLENTLFRHPTCADSCRLERSLIQRRGAGAVSECLKNSIKQQNSNGISMYNYSVVLNSWIHLNTRGRNSYISWCKAVFVSWQGGYQNRRALARGENTTSWWAFLNHLSILSSVSIPFCNYELKLVRFLSFVPYLSQYSIEW